MKNTKIQWCHGTVNPVMGCDGCELWPTVTQLKGQIIKAIPAYFDIPPGKVDEAVCGAIGERETSAIYRDREQIAKEIDVRLNLMPEKCIRDLEDIIRRGCKCYAGLLGTMRAGHNGYADAFESPKLYAGRMVKAANWSQAEGKEIEDKPWLKGLPRLNFISDMGDALSESISFDHLQCEIIENVIAACPSGTPNPSSTVWRRFRAKI